MNERPIVITAGHSNTDPGAPGQGISEARMMAELRNIVAYKLRMAGQEVITDGSGPVNAPLSSAIKPIPQGRVAVELHVNSAVSPRATGVECFGPEYRKALAQRLCAGVSRVLGIPIRGSNGGWKHERESARGRLGYVRAGGLILEVFFASNPEEHTKYSAKKWLVAQAIVDALLGGDV